MAIRLGDNRYGKSESRLVRVVRDGARHEVRDLTVSSSLRGDFDAAHLTGDQANVLPTDTQKNTVYAFAKEHGVGTAEEFALLLARHFVDDVEPVTSAQVQVEEVRWDRAIVDGAPHDHTFVRSGAETRTAVVTAYGSPHGGAHVVSGLTGLVVLKSTGSEFRDFLVDRWTTLAPTDDRVLATSLTARWRWSAVPSDGYDAAYDEIRSLLVSRFGSLHSRALQQSLWEMGRTVLGARADVAELRMSAPNKHHYLVDLAPFGLDNPGEVFVAGDRPYGLIEVVVERDDEQRAADAPDAPDAWRDLPGFV
jgi:urate oxidase